MSCSDLSHIRLGPQPWTEKNQQALEANVQKVVDEIIKRRNTMERVRAKFTVSQTFKDKNGNTLVKLYAVYNGDESSPENESFSNSTPSGNCEMYITNPAAGEFFENLAGKYVYLDFTPAS